MVNDYKAIMPIIILVIGSFITFMGTRLAPRNKSMVGAILSSSTIILSLAFLFPLFEAVSNGQIITFPTTNSPFMTHARVDAMSMLLSVTALLLGLLVSVFSYKYMEDDMSQDKYFSLLLIMLASIVGLSTTADLFNLWVCFELMCISSYILVAFRKERWESVEAGFKYLVMSVTGSMLVLLGISAIFSQVGHMDMNLIRDHMNHIDKLPLVAAVVLFIAGFGVKAAIVPFHTWLPDAHSEAPSGISAMLSGIVIEAGLFAMLRALLALTGLNINIGATLIILALISILVGNVMALAQTRLKRMLAYSSVAQMGYIVLALGIGIQFQEMTGLQGGFFHIITHAGMKGLSFLAAGIVIHSIGSGEIGDMKGLAKKMPLLSLCFAISVLGLAGVPPFSGFMSKWLIYKSGIMVGGIGYFLTVFAVFNSVLSLGYYLPVLNAFYSKDESKSVASSHSVGGVIMLPLVILAFITVLLGIFPEIGLKLSGPAAEHMMSVLRSYQ